METCEPPIDRKFCSSKTILNFPEKRLDPMVVLVDIALQNKRLNGNISKMSVKSSEENNNKELRPGNKSYLKRKNSFKNLKNLTSYTSPASSEKENSNQRTWDPDKEYEVEKIIHHYRDKKQKMFYLIKWKNWPKEYNTYEPIENLTQCNRLLSKYFKRREPLAAELAEMKSLVKNQLRTNSFYQKLIKNNFRKKDLLELSTTCLNIDELFKKTEDLHSLEENINEQFKYLIECLVCMSKDEDLDEGIMKRAEYYKMWKKLIQIRKLRLKSISAAEKAINRLEKVPVKIENEIDLEPFPNFEYLADLKAGDGVFIPEAVIGCECQGNCGPESKCCGVLADSVFAYNSHGRLKITEKIPIYECNRKCSCSSRCLNRVVQNGRKIKLCIFKTESYGWGVKTLEDIPKGTYVCEYVGELVPSSEANARASDYIKKNISYLFDLDFNPDSGPTTYTIDATKCGNLARFINHSCSPNLLVCPVWIDCLDIDMPRLAFFAKKNIKKKDEITFDYQNAPEDIGRPIIKRNGKADTQCMCMASNCRQWIFGVK